MKPMELRGRWVLITGASAGLGQAFARQLAKKYGANIVAVARRRDRLDALKKELESEAHVEVHAVVADLSKLEEVDRALREAKEGRHLYAAVLNAGITHFGKHDALSWPAFESMLQTNVIGVVRMVTDLIPYLEKQAEGGGILIVSSMAGINPVPYQTHYSATKAFLVHYGLGLWHELQGKNVSVTTYTPAGIATEMTAGAEFTRLRGWLADVNDVAREGIEALRTRRYLAIPGATNRVGDALMRVLPRRFVASRLASVYRKALRAHAATGKA
jgi:short-subunit dehydrogenase